MDDLAAVIDVLRRERAHTRPEIARQAHLGRNIVSDRLAVAARLGLVEMAGTVTGARGRAPERWRFRSEAGVVLSACLGAGTTQVAIADARGSILSRSKFEWQVSQGPVATLERIDREFREILGARPVQDVWGIGIGLPGPVDHHSGRPVDPPIMPGWDGFDIRDWFSARWHAGTWVDNDVNAMARGHRVSHPELEDFIYVKVGTGIGAGLYSNGMPHRGAAGAAGDVGHVRVSDRSDVICRCGRVGCLEALASGWALARDATTAAIEGRSPWLRALLAEHGEITPADVGQGSRQGDAVCVELEGRSAGVLGNVLAVLVNVFNPRAIVIGGGVVGSGTLYLPAVSRAIEERCNRLAARDLSITEGERGESEGVVGCGAMVLDALLSASFLTTWVEHRRPHGVAAITGRAEQDVSGSPAP